MILLIINILLLSFIIHELGHFLYFRFVIGRKVEVRIYCNSLKDCGIRVGYPSDYRVLSRSHKFLLYFNGVTWGFIFAFMFSFYYNVSILVIPIYFFGCWKDFKNMWRVTR